MKRPARDAGFTLLEILVALLVFGFLMVGLSETTRYGMATWTAQSRAASGPADRAAADAALRRLLEQAVPAGFTGAPDSLAFTTRLPAGSGLGDRLADVSLYAVPGRGLLLGWAAHAAGTPLTPPPPPAILTVLAGVRAIRVTYLAAQPSGPPLWTDRWTAATAPLLVRIGFTFSGRDHWPDIVIAPLSGG